MQPRRFGLARKTVEAAPHGTRVQGPPCRGGRSGSGHCGQYIGAVPLSWIALPSLCAVCRGWDRGRVCAACRARYAALRARCLRCALPVPDGVPVCGDCVLHPPSLDRAIASVDYGFPWDHLLAQLKFHDALDLADSLAGLMHDAVLSSDAPRVGLVVPVPLSRERLRERGFNQTWELARRVASRLRIEASATALLRVKDTPHQLSLPRDERAGNVRGAFALEPREAPLLRGQTVAVVDDVMTTGTTLGEVAQVLRRAGAREVHAWVVARTPRPGDE
jgi:ComF family protein